MSVVQIDTPLSILVHHGTRTDRKRLSVSWRPAPQLTEECGTKPNLPEISPLLVPSSVLTSQLSPEISVPTPGKRGEHLFPPPDMTEDQKAHYLSRVTTKSPFTPAPKTRKEMLKDPFVNEYVMAEKEEVANLASLGTFEIARRSGLPKQPKTEM